MHVNTAKGIYQNAFAQILEEADTADPAENEKNFDLVQTQLAQLQDDIHHRIADDVPLLALEHFPSSTLPYPNLTTLEPKEALEAAEEFLEDFQDDFDPTPEELASTNGQIMDTILDAYDHYLKTAQNTYNANPADPQARNEITKLNELQTALIYNVAKKDPALVTAP